MQAFVKMGFKADIYTIGTLLVLATHVSKYTIFVERLHIPYFDIIAKVHDILMILIFCQSTVLTLLW